jgi:RND family efflux transporter MFP subunit
MAFLHMTVQPSRPRSLLLSLALLVTLAGCGGDSETTSPPPPTTVQTEEVKPVSQATDRSFSGTLRAPLETNLSFRVPGQVMGVYVDVGTAVEAGDLIARLDPEDYRLEMESARATYREAKAAAENAKAEFQRLKTLYANDNASLSAYDRARTAYETSQSRAEAAKRQLDLAEKRLTYTRLTAPASGSIADKRVQEGENVAVGQPVARLTAGDRLEVQVQVPESRISQLSVGQSATVRTSSGVSRSLPATVTEVASAPSGSRPTYPVVVTLNASDPALRSGMSAQVGLSFGSSDGVLVPSGAVTQDEHGAFVYAVAPAPDSLAAGSGTQRPDGIVQRRAVETGDLTPQGLRVTGALRTGDRVVTAGLSAISEGDPVRFSRLFSQE